MDAARSRLQVGPHGHYRITCYVLVNGSGSPSITLQMSYFDANASASYTEYFAGINSPISTGVVPLNGAGSGLGANLAPFPMIVYAASGHNIVVAYTNSGATPNDRVSAFIERLS